MDEEALAGLWGDSLPWAEVRALLGPVATSDLPVLILGETGTGKELVARAIHALSRRRRSACVTHNCGATPDSLIESELFGHARGAFTGAIGERAGLFELADAGTLFLDEVGDASPLLQMKLLRALQEGEVRRVGETRLRRVDVRIVAATHRPLEEAARRGEFRSDLLFRLNAVCLRLPPLRERGRDVVVLARRLLARAAATCEAPAPALHPELEQLLLRHAWPGNVRELANGCAFAVQVRGARGLVEPRHWPVDLGAVRAEAAHGLHAETRALESQRLRETLQRTRGNKSSAARALGLSRQGLLKKLRRYGLEAGTAAGEGDVMLGEPGADPAGVA